MSSFVCRESPELLRRRYEENLALLGRGLGLLRDDTGGDMPLLVRMGGEVTDSVLLESDEVVERRRSKLVNGEVGGGS